MVHLLLNFMHGQAQVHSYSNLAHLFVRILVKSTVSVGKGTPNHGSKCKDYPKT